MSSLLHDTLARDLCIMIVEDERPARSELRRILLSLGMTGEIREASSVSEAIPLAKSSRPDLILLDIQMPGGSGFDLLRKLGPDRPPVIFTTAYEHFAVQAFEEKAVDYLLKPFDKARLAKALSRLKSSETQDTRLTSGDVILLKIDGECLLLPINEIQLIESSTEGTTVHWDQGKGIVNRPLQRLEERLDPRLFFRCSREALVNIHAIRETRQEEEGLRVRLSSGREILFSRRQGALFRKNHRA